MEIFSKILSKTDINRRCVVPMKYFKMKRFPKPKLGGNGMVDILVTDESGHNWILRCSTRNIGKDLNHPKHPKPILIKEWIPFVQRKKLRVGDRVIIYEQQDETGSMHLRIKVEKRSSPTEACWSPVTNQYLDGNKGSISHSSDNESTAIFQPFGDLLVDALNHDLDGNAAVKTSSIDKEQISTPHSTSQHVACYKTERPSSSVSLELTLKPTMTGGTTAATRSGIDKEQTPTFHSTSQDIASNKTKTPSLGLRLGLTLKPTMTEGHQQAYMQGAEPKTKDFLSSFHSA
ncbi:hypothetical protein CRYUN_Cryun16bG0093400 [Craigia yunnanensis]